MADYSRSPSLFDVPHSRWSDPETSRDAARSVDPRKLTKTQERVYSLIKMRGPLTDDELVDHYLEIWPESASPQGIRSRRSELSRRGLLVRLDRLGTSRYGRPCAIWRTAS